jgi:hypothetical protein
MDTQHYRQLVQTLLAQHAQSKPAYGEIEVELIFDTERDAIKSFTWAGITNAVFIIA